jgi:hypothetical protein
MHGSKLLACAAQREQKDACELERNDAKSLALLYSIVPHETCSLFEEG